MSSMVAASIAPEFRRYLAHLTFGARQHCTIFGGLFDFVGRPRLREFVLELLQRIGANRAPLPTQHHESHGPIQPRNFFVHQGASELLG